MAKILKHKIAWNRHKMRKYIKCPKYFFNYAFKNINLYKNPQSGCSLVSCENINCTFKIL